MLEITACTMFRVSSVCASNVIFAACDKLLLLYSNTILLCNDFGTVADVGSDINSGKNKKDFSNFLCSLLTYTVNKTDHNHYSKRNSCS